MFGPQNFQEYATSPACCAGACGWINWDLEDENNQLAITNQTFWCYLVQLMDIYMSVFEWENLPEGCDARQLEYWLMTCGLVGFVYDPLLAEAQPWQAPEGYAIMRMTLNGQMDIYNIPQDRTAFSVAQGVNNIPLDEENSVVIWNDQLRVPPIQALNLFAYRLTLAQRSLDSNVSQQKFANLLKASIKQRKTIRSIMGKVFRGVPWIQVDDDMSVPIEPLKVAPEDRMDSLYSTIQNIWNDAKTFCGIETTSRKSERVFSTEASANLGGVDAFRFTRLVPRQKACEEINRLLEKNGHEANVSVKFREGVYVRGDMGDVIAADQPGEGGFSDNTGKGDI